MREQLYACEPTFLVAYLERLENASEEEVRLAAQMFGESPEDDDDHLEEETDEEGNVRVRIEGPLSMSGPSPLARLFGGQGTSYQQIVAWAKDCRRRRPRSVALEFNSPGGEVPGADLAYQAIRALAAEVPTRAEVSGMCASAAYWLAVACPDIRALSPAAEVGSIGVKIVAIDDSGLRDALGIKRVTIVSRNAPRKDDNPSTKAGRDVLQERADAMEAVFIQRIAEGRKTSTEDVEANYGRGALLIASEARRVGMIDAIQDSIPASRQAASLAAQAAGLLVAQNQTPAPPAKKEKPMTLKELLASDPLARSEYEKALAEARAEGVKAVEARITAAKPYLALQVVQRALERQAGNTDSLKTYAGPFFLRQSCPRTQHLEGEGKTVGDRHLREQRRILERLCHISRCQCSNCDIAPPRHCFEPGVRCFV